ncbi:MAG TPA: MAPEG family protein [Polyangia bacterium]|jgi:hypothetical protein|nr:MAPEG family protein [Polyangia bacterium]
MTNAIFRPVVVLALWTGAIMLMTGLGRLWAVRRGRVPVTVFSAGEAPEVPENLRIPNRNLMNLLEMPVLFYVVCTAFYVTGRGGEGMVTLAWTYVGLRLVHSLIHLTYNRVGHRFLAFAASNVVLLIMWARFARTVF